MSKIKKGDQKLKIISEEQFTNAEIQIREKEKLVDYRITEYPIDVLVEKYWNGIEDDANEIFVPEYQRDFVWDEKRKSKFVESVILGLPIPFLFCADLQDSGRLEIVDGVQRIRTLTEFLKQDLTLQDLEELTELNGCGFRHLISSRQLRFNRRTIRMIVLTERTEVETRRKIFERLNTGSQLLVDMEKRKGIYDGPFYEFLKECSENELFRELCPISLKQLSREEGAERLLRYFAYADDYEHYNQQVASFLDQYMKKHRERFERERMQQEFQEMLEFVRKYFGNKGFRKREKDESVPRVRFEALAVGVTLALRENSELVPKDINSWFDKLVFKFFTVSDAGNNTPKVKGRVEYVRDQLLGKKSPIEIDQEYIKKAGKSFKKFTGNRLSFFSPETDQFED